MNKTLMPIFARRSIRKYQKDEIPDSTIRDLLEAAMAAPSAVENDPWHFIVIRDKTTMKNLAKGLPNGKDMLEHAPLAIVVCGDINKAHRQSESYMLQDCSAAIENLLIAVSMLGLGACWIGVHPRQERIEHVRKIFNTMPEYIIPVAIVTVGKPAEKHEARTRYREEAVHIERW